MRIPLLPFVAGIVVVAAAAIRLLRPHENWSWVAIGAAMVAIACVSSLLLVAKPPDPRRRAFALVLLLTLVPLHLAGRADVPRDPVWEHLKAQIRHDIAHGCPGERGVAARALLVRARRRLVARATCRHARPTWALSCPDSGHKRAHIHERRRAHRRINDLLGSCT